MDSGVEKPGVRNAGYCRRIFIPLKEKHGALLAQTSGACFQPTHGGVVRAPDFAAVCIATASAFPLAVPLKYLTPSAIIRGSSLVC